MTLAATPGQTVGPFFGYALPFPHDNELVPPGTPGAVRLHGRVYDGAGDPVPDAILELWQADAEGNVVQEPGSLRRARSRLSSASPASAARRPTPTGTTRSRPWCPARRSSR